LIDSNRRPLRSLGRAVLGSVLHVSSGALIFFVHDGHGFTFFGNPFRFPCCYVIRTSKDCIHSLKGDALGFRKNEVNGYLKDTAVIGQ
jgi:hypothetical protein